MVFDSVFYNPSEIKAQLLAGLSAYDAPNLAKIEVCAVKNSISYEKIKKHRLFLDKSEEERKKF